MNRLVLVVLPLLWSCAQARDPPTTEAETEIDAVVAEAEGLYWDGQHAAAKGMWLHVLDSARVRRDSLLEARLLTWLGLAEWQLGDYAAAGQLGEEALELKLHRHPRPIWGACNVAPLGRGASHYGYARA